MNCRQGDWCWVAHPRTHRHGSLCYPQAWMTCCHLDILRIFLMQYFFMFHLQALHGRLLQTLPFSFGSLRFASSFKVKMKILTHSFYPGETCSIISLQPALQSGLPVHAWLFVSERSVCIDQDRKKEATFVCPFPTCCLELNVFFPPLSLPKCASIVII